MDWLPVRSEIDPHHPVPVGRVPVPAAVEGDVRLGSVRVELDVERRCVRVEVKTARHAVRAVVGVRHAVGLEQRADHDVLEAYVLGVPGRDAGRVAVVETFVAVGGGVEGAVIRQTLSRVVVVDVPAAEAEIVHLVFY